MKKSAKCLCIILAIILVCSIAQNLVMTNGGKTRVEDVSWVTDDGAYMTARIYLPKGVDADNPAPAVVAAHGWNNTLEVQEVNCIELSRRGYIVIAPDAYGHGNSTQAVGLMTDDDMADGRLDGAVNLDAEGDAAVQDGGVYSCLQYLGTLPFVNKENIGLVGHSMGGYIIQMAALRALTNAQNDSSVVVPKAICVMCEGAAADFSVFSLSIATLTPEYDEFGTGHWNVENPALANTSAKLKACFGFDENAADIQYGQFYSFGEEAALSRTDAILAAEEGKLRVSYMIPGRTHPGAHNSAVAAADIIDFFNITLKAGEEDALDLSNQTWMIKNIAGLISLIMYFLMLIPTAMLLIQTSFFKSLVHKPYPGVALSTGRNKVRYALLFVLGMVPSFLLFYPLMGAPIDVKFMNYLSPIPWMISDAFPMPIMNGLSLFNVVIGIILLVLFLITYKLIYIKQGVSFKAFGLCDKAGNILKALLLAVLTFLAAYLTLSVMNYFFGIDYRFFTLSMKTITPIKWGLYLRYVLFFAVFYVINSLVLNAQIAVEGKKEWLNYLLCILSSVGGLLVLHIVAYGGFFATGHLWLLNYCSLGGNSAMAAILVWGLLLALPLSAIVARYLYKKTGNIWIGGLINTFAVTLFAISNTAISTAIFY